MNQKTWTNSYQMRKVVRIHSIPHNDKFILQMLKNTLTRRWLRYYFGYSCSLLHPSMKSIGNGNDSVNQQ